MCDIFKKSIIYVATSPSGKQYVGQTVQTFKDRIKDHKKNSSNCTLLKKAIKKYGFDNLSWKVIEEIPKFLLNDRESHWIQVLNTLAPNGYNCDTGGNAKKQLSQALKNKISVGVSSHNIMRKGYLGFAEKRGDKRFVPVVTVNNRRKYLSESYFETREEAIQVLRSYTRDPSSFTKIKNNRRRARKGVYFNKLRGKWLVEPMRNLYFGAYDTESDANDALAHWQQMNEAQ
jgi:group I intron endonuclease